MFWYLSFLRPPPVHVTPATGHVTITPQVANDLRTELRTAATEIDYVWQCVAPKRRARHAPRPLVAYAPPANTYTPIDVPLPPGIKVGEHWRLGLVERGRTGARARLRDLCGDDIGVVPVWSMGIEVRRPEVAGEGSGAVRGVAGRREKPGHAAAGDVAGPAKEGHGKHTGKGKGKDDVPKQTRVQREWLMSDDKPLYIIEQTSFDLDKKIWDSGLALASWLWHWGDSGQQHADAHAAGILSDVRSSACLVELGSGTGLVSFALRLFNAFETHIFATDLPSALDLMRENIQLNSFDVDYFDSNVPITPMALDWEQPLPTSFGGRWPDLVVCVHAADVTYNTASFAALVDTLDGLMVARDGKKAPRLLLAYKQRDEAERHLWDMLGKRGIEMHLADRVRGSEQHGQVEIWVGAKR